MHLAGHGPRSAANWWHGEQTLVPSQHPRPRHRLRAAGHCVLLAASNHPFSNLRVDSQDWLGSTVVSGEGQILQERLGLSPSAWSHQGGLGEKVQALGADVAEGDGLGSGGGLRSSALREAQDFSAMR